MSHHVRAGVTALYDKKQQAQEVKESKESVKRQTNNDKEGYVICIRGRRAH
jgi:hypothetical protein